MITIRNLNKTYDRRKKTANRVVRDMSLDLPDTGFVCIVGESGCGKTSLLNALGGLDVFDNGQIATENIKVSRYGTRAMETERNNNFGYIFQNHYLLPDHSVAYNVYLGLHSLKLSHGEKLARVREALQAVNMERYIRRVVSELSGGQQQRVAIARALARRPRVIFADEPTGNLDEENTLNICTILRQISKTSLVVMVTHEERIARFFADRIITLKGGVIAKDCDSWERQGLVSGGESILYRGDYVQEKTQTDSVCLWVLHAEGAPPAELEIVVLEDRIIIKTADERMVSTSGPEETPILKEGKRPTLTLETVDNQPQIEMNHQTSPARAGSGLSFGMMLQETFNLIQGKGLKRLSAWIFLVVMSVLTVWIVGDYLSVKAVDPKDFVITDSHILEIKIERGPQLPMSARGGVIALVPDFLDYLEQGDVNFEYMPNVAGELRCALQIFPQMESVSEGLPGFSYIPLRTLDENSLVHGRMPELRNEVVVDIWVLENFLEKDGIIQNTVSKAEDLLGAQLSYLKQEISFTIVGICDTGEPALYLTESAYMSVCSSGESVMTYDEFLKVSSAPSYFEGIELKTNECILGIEMAGSAYRNVLDCIGYVRQLGEMKPPVGVLFETEGIYTLDHRSEMQLSFMATTAQEESHNKSEIMNASIEMRFRRGIFLTPKLLGYDLDSDGNLVVNEEEAKTVRLIFFMYLYGYSTQQIADTLEKYGRPTKKGRIEWSPNTVLGVLQNERHCGDVLARKTWTPNYLNHKSKKNRQDRNQYRQKNHHEAIISRDDFIAVQKMIANAKYGNKGILPELHVIATGALRGFVSVHPRWAGFSVKDYHKASESVYDPQLRLPDEPQNIVVDEGSFDLRGYEIARSQFITTQNQLTCTMGIQELKFGIHGIRKMDNVEYVELLIHPTEKALAVRKSTKANKYAIWWAQPKDGVIVPRKIAATSFMKTIFEMLGWRDDCRYRVRGVRKQDENETVLVFDLQDTEVFLPHQTPPSTDEEMEGAELQPTEGSSATRSPARVSAYPAEWVESFGDEFYRHVHTRDPKGFSETADWQLHAPGQVFNEDPLNTTSREEIQLGISSMLAEMDNTGVDSNE